jgi:Tfp pilus assembly protein FimT
MVHKNGVTIIELLVVVGIISLLTIVSLPLLLSYQKTTKLKNEALNLAINLRLAQQLAVTEQVIYNVKIFPAEKKYQIINSGSGVVRKEVILDQEISSITTSELTDNTARFNATGGAVESGSITLINTRNNSSAVQIKPSGYVEVTN